MLLFDPTQEGRKRRNMKYYFPNRPGFTYENRDISANRCCYRNEKSRIDSGSIGVDTKLVSIIESANNSSAIGSEIVDRGATIVKFALPL